MAVAQLAECLSPKQKVVGSSPTCYVRFTSAKASYFNGEHMGIKNIDKETQNEICKTKDSIASVYNVISELRESIEELEDHTSILGGHSYATANNKTAETYGYMERLLNEQMFHLKGAIVLLYELKLKLDKLYKEAYGKKNC